ncbi:MAG: GT4 family glycosyltransferase PelF, partial [Selenomonadaceae bacterium]|nr:GT4 family glycosyltransferase PelF [Selenomonadaceae bacterium]
MKICLLTEDSYPYVAGGFSSWVQMLMEGLPEHEFLIYSIGMEAKDRGKYKYELPKNCVGIREEFLDDILSRKASGMQEGILSLSEREALHDMVAGDKEIPFLDLVEIFHYGRKERAPLDVFMSSDFFGIIQRVHEEKYRYLPFADFFWTIRSMFLPLFCLLQQDLPEADVYHGIATGYCGIIGGMATTVCKKPFLITEHGVYAREREAEIVRSDWAKGDFKAIWIKHFYRLARLAYRMADH